MNFYSLISYASTVSKVIFDYHTSSHMDVLVEPDRAEFHFTKDDGSLIGVIYLTEASDKVVASSDFDIPNFPSGDICFLGNFSYRVALWDDYKSDYVNSTPLYS